MKPTRLLPLFLTALLGASVWLAWQGPVSADPDQSSCSNPDTSGATLEVDTIWEDEVYIGRDLTVRNNSTLTITPGTRVIFCDNYGITIGGLFNPARLMALGTAEEPIIFEPAPGVQAWDKLYFGDTIYEISVIQHAEFRNGGGEENVDDAATIEISTRHAVVTQTSPIIDQVSIIDSIGYGMNIAINDVDDPTPAAISNVTISGSGKAPIYTDGSGVSALVGPLTLTDNVTQSIQVNGFAMYFDQRWRDHGVPYEIEETIRMRNADPFQPFSTWHIDPGVTILMGPLAGLTIDGDARVAWIGSEDDPITIEQLDESGDPWGEVSLSASEPGVNKMAYVQLINGGGLPDTNVSGIIKHTFGGSLELEHVTVTGSQNAGLYHSKGDVTINQSRFEGNEIGIEFWSGSAVVRNTAFVNNTSYGFFNQNPRDYCVDAGGNYWGAPSGPADATTAGVQCNDAGITNTGSGDTTSDGVLYFPWLTDADTGIVTDHSTLSVGDKLWVVGNGVDAAPITLTLRDENGDPVAGKEIEFRTTRGSFSAAGGTTNGAGQLLTNLTSTEIGNTEITAFNVTDNEPVAARLSIYFWQGGEDTGGLVNQSGSPYASPEMIVEGEPYEAGKPVIFKLPMRNTQPNPLQIDVSYTIQGFGIASGGEVVSTPSTVLQPDESWDAIGGYTPADSGHRCVIYDVAYTDASGQRVVVQGGGFGGRKNLKNPDNPCDNLDATKMVPGKPGGLGAVIKHFINVLDQTNKVNKCLGSSLTFRQRGLYQESFESPTVLQTFTPPAYDGSGGESQAAIDAVNALTQTAAEIAALNIAIAEARTKANDAAQADEWESAAERLTEVRDFEADRVEKLNLYLTEIDVVLNELDAATLDTVFTSDDYVNYLAQLKATGFDADTVAFHKATGLSDADIEAMLTETIAALESNDAQSSETLRSLLVGIRADVQREALGQAKFLNVGLAAGGGRSIGQDEPSNLIGWGEMVETFEVGNPTAITDTVKLIVRTGDMPPQWSYSLDRDELELGPGETTTVTLTVDTGLLPVLADETIYFGVEGFIDDQFIGGVMFENRIPVNPNAGPAPIFLPYITR